MTRTKQETVLELRRKEKEARKSMHGEFKSYFEGKIQSGEKSES